MGPYLPVCCQSVFLGQTVPTCPEIGLPARCSVSINISRSLLCIRHGARLGCLINGQRLGDAVVVRRIRFGEPPMTADLELGLVLFSAPVRITEFTPKYHTLTSLCRLRHIPSG